MSEKYLETKISKIESKLSEPPKENVLEKQLAELRKKVHMEIIKEWQERLENDNNPQPTEVEINMGVFLGWLEPQVRDAVLEFNKKGYATESSGFWNGSKAQVINGCFFIDEDTQKKIEELGAQVLRGGEIPEGRISKYNTQIKFYPKEANLEQIKKKWDAIADALPKTDGPEAVCPGDGAGNFREHNAPEQLQPNLRKKLYDYLDWEKNKVDKFNNNDKKVKDMK